MNPDGAEATPRHTFPRRARLKKRRLLAPLFRRGQAQTLAGGSIRLIYRVVPRAEVEAGVQVAFIPGRRAPAVARNRVRRSLREVYRVHAHELVGLFLHRPEALTLAILYRGPSARIFGQVRRDLPPLLGRLVHALRIEDSRNPPDS